MSAKRPSGKRYFTMRQKNRAVELLLAGHSKPEVCAAMGYSMSGLDYLLRRRFGVSDLTAIRAQQAAGGVEIKLAAKAKPAAKPTGQTATSVRRQSTANAETAYLQWVLQGALAKVGATNYVDRLIIDIRDGKLG